MPKEWRRSDDLPRAGAGQGNRFAMGDSARTRSEDDHPVGEEDRFIDVVGDKEHGLPISFPAFQ